VAESLKVPAYVWQEAFSGFLQDDFSDELHKIEAPTLIIWGDRETFSPGSDQEQLVAAIQDSQLIVYSNAGHSLHWEQPKRFVADLASFITTYQEKYHGSVQKQPAAII
jgi:non-heme chloroperoxidase